MIRSAPAAASLACIANRSAKLPRTVVTGQDEQVVERRHLPAEPALRKPLVEAVENVGGPVAARICEKPPRDTGRLRQAQRAKVSLRTVEPIPTFRKISLPAKPFRISRE